MSAIRRLMHIVTPSLNALLRKPFGNLPVNSHFLSNNHKSIVPSITSVAGLRTRAAQKRETWEFPKPPPYQETVHDNTEKELCVIDEVVSKVNTQIQNLSHGRLFAVIHLRNQQWKITPEDVIVIEGHWPPRAGESIRLEQVLLVGSADFTLVGMPLLRPDLVNVQATVVEKRMTHIKTNFKKKRRKQYQRINFYKFQLTMLRINSITLASELNENKDIEGIDGRIF